jgi:predicted RNA methylase
VTEVPDPTIWSSSDYPYQCLKDRGRTMALIDAVRSIVRSGDVVLDLGSGTGILALAAAAGARKVLAVEVDRVLAAALRVTVEANGFGSTIEVVPGDVMGLRLPEVDVVLAEIIDTGLVEEMFVPAMNHLWERGTVTARTRLLFEGYSTTAQLVEADHEYYGFTIMAPKHEWPFYEAASAGTGWEPTSWSPAGPVTDVGSWDFGAGPVDPDVGPVPVEGAGAANALLLAGTVRLGDGRTMGAHNAFNGLKLLPLPPAVAGRSLHLAYRMGGGLSSVELSADVIDLTASDGQGSVSAILS